MLFWRRTVNLTEIPFVPPPGPAPTQAENYLYQPKEVLAHVYDSDGNYIKTWNDFATPPVFRSVINNGLGAFTFQLPRNWGFAGELGDGGSDDLTHGNIVKLYVVDRESEEGVLIYQGSLQHYRMHLTSGLVEDITLISKASLLGDRTVRGPISFVDVDPRDMMKYFVDNGYLPGVTWSAFNPAVGQLYSATFESEKIGQIFARIVQLAGGRWYYRFDPDNSLIFRDWNKNEIDHSLIIGKHVAGDVSYVRSSIDIKKRVFVFGQPEQRDDDGVLIQEAVEAVASQPGYDPTIEPRDLFYTNPRISGNDQAARVATALLEFYSEPLIETEFEVVDSNIDIFRGYDIESLAPGHVIRLVNPERSLQRRIWGDGSIWGDGGIWGATWFEQVQEGLVISELEYRFESCWVKLTSLPLRLVEELVQVADRVSLVGS